MKKSLALAVLVVACTRAEPSVAYESAQNLWSEALRDGPSQAYLDPRADEVLELLSQVGRDGPEAPYAAKLAAEIVAGRKKALVQREETERILARARDDIHPAPPPEAFPGEARASGTPRPDPEVAVAADAGRPDASGPSDPELELDAAEFRSRFSRCFEEGGPALVGGSAGGKIWALKDLKVCRELHPGFVSTGVLLYEGKVRALRPLSELEPRRWRVVAGQLVPAEEAERMEREAAARAPEPEPPAAEP